MLARASAEQDADPQPSLCHSETEYVRLPVPARDAYLVVVRLPKQ
jgi:hypothetical protein